MGIDAKRRPESLSHKPQASKLKAQSPACVNDKKQTPSQSSSTPVACSAPRPADCFQLYLMTWESGIGYERWVSGRC